MILFGSNLCTHALPQNYLLDLFNGEPGSERQGCRRLTLVRCPANMAHIRQPRPDYGLGYGLGCQVKVVETLNVVPSSTLKFVPSSTLYVVPSSLGSGTRDCTRRDGNGRGAENADLRTSRLPFARAAPARHCTHYLTT